MAGETLEDRRFSRWLPCLAVSFLLANVLLITINDSDFGIFLAFAVTIVASLPLLILATIKKAQRLSIAATLAIYWIASYAMFEHGEVVHETMRWFVLSGSYKAEVLAQPNPPNGQLKHIEWAGWGFAGMDTSVYLVFDPKDSLESAAQSGRPGRYTGISCEVPAVRRLQRGWYSVVFYTNTNWDFCTY